MLAVALRGLSQMGANNRIAIDSSRGGTEVHSFELADGSVRSLKFCRDGRTLYSGMDRGDVLVWPLR